MKKILFSIILFGTSMITYSQSPEEIIIEAITFLDKGNYESALSTYEKGIEKYPELPIFYVLKGEMFAKSNRRLTSNEEVYVKALKQFDLAIDLDSTFYPAYSSRGLLNIFHQKFDLAILDFTNALKYASNIDDQFNALTDLGSAKLYSKDYKGAIIEYEKALNIRPNEIGIFINMATILMNLKQFDKAEETFIKAIAIDPFNTSLLNNLALLNIDMGNYEEAILKLEKAIEIKPDEPYSYNNLGLAKIKIGEVERALELINKSLSMYPKNSYAYKHRAMAFFELGRNDEACDDLNKANQLGYSDTFDDEVNDLIGLNCKK